MKRVLDSLDARFVAGSDEVQTLIAVGFIENLPRRGQAGYDIRRGLSREVVAAAKRAILQLP